MFNGLLKPAWQSKSTEKRRLAVLKLNPQHAENQQIFEQLALNDESQDVRAACLSKMMAPESVFKVYLNQQNLETKQGAKQAFCELIGQQSKFNDHQFDTLIEQINSLFSNDQCLECLSLIAQHAPIAVLRQRLIIGFTEGQIAAIIADIRYADTRLLAAQSLSQIESLELARKELKGKDKRAEKEIRIKLEHYRTDQKLRDSVNAAAEELCQNMAFIAEHPQWRSEFKAKYHSYVTKWSGLELSPEAHYAARFNASESLAANKVAIQTEQEQRQQAQITLAQNLERYSASLASLSLAELSQERASINTVLGEALASWREPDAISSASDDVSARFNTSQNALSRLATLLESLELSEHAKASARLNELAWPASLPPLSSVNDIQALLLEHKESSEQAQKDYKKDLDTLHKRINRLLGTSNKGDLRRAKNELAASSKAASAYTGRDGKLLAERIDAATELVGKMNDWQSFAIEPKLVELCESMESLINSKAKPDNVAKKISELQNKWKNLGHADVSDTHWQRFKDAADKAYAPCAIFFEQRKATQKANLTLREPLLERMRTILNTTDWQEPQDWKALDSNLRTLGQQWRDIKNVDPNAGKKQWQAFNSARQEILDKFDVVYDANIALKETLIRQTEALADKPVNELSLETLKVYQTRWRQVGITRRKQDQAAWAKFRAACDALFEKVQASRNELRASQDIEIAAYKELTLAINQLAKSSTELTNSDPEFERLCNDYQALPALPKELPEKLVDRINNDHQRAKDNYSKARDLIIQSARDSIFDKLREKADLCSKLEKAVDDKQDSLISAIQSQLDEIEIDDSQLSKEFAIRLNATQDSNRGNASAARRELCIRLEIALDTASPKQDKALRMQLQLQRMSDNGLSASTTSLADRLQQFKQDWLCMPGAEPAVQADLDSRFWALINKS